MNGEWIKQDYNNVLCDFFNNYKERCCLFWNTILGEFSVQIFHSNRHEKKLPQIKIPTSLTCHNDHLLSEIAGQVSILLTIKCWLVVIYSTQVQKMLQNIPYAIFHSLLDCMKSLYTSLTNISRFKHCTTYKGQHSSCYG